MKYAFVICLLGTLCCHSTPIEQKTAKTEALDTTVVERDTLPQKAQFSIDYIRGRFKPAEHPDFTVVDKSMTDGSQRYYMRKDAYDAFRRMNEAARADGIDLTIVSATRNFDRQKSIWEAKWTGNRLLEGVEKAPLVYPNPKDRAMAILRWSSMPGTSRHHWGTDIDINKLNNSYFETGQGLKEYEWLSTRAHEFGFCQPYSPKGEDRPHGYNEEKWHWSYEPIARQLTDLAQNFLQDSLIDGFKGAETATMIGVVDKYVLGVNHSCKE